ncbi:MAG: aconitase family protein [Tepidamorphaceae bacterium]
MPARCRGHFHRDRRERSRACSVVLSGNRNFEVASNQDVKANWLASPPLVVAYALAGSLNINLAREPLGTGRTVNRSI